MSSLVHFSLFRGYQYFYTLFLPPCSCILDFRNILSVSVLYTCFQLAVKSFEIVILKSTYSDSSPNTVSPNTDFAPTRFWFSYKIIHFYTTNSAIPHSSAIFKNFHIVQSQSPPIVRFRLTRFFSGPKMRVRRGPAVYIFYIYSIYIYVYIYFYL